MAKPRAHKVTVPVGSILELHLIENPERIPATEIMLLANSMATILRLQGQFGANGGEVMSLTDRRNGRTSVVALGREPAQPLEAESQGNKVDPDPGNTAEVQSFMDQALNFSMSPSTP